jgi:hypothetical protein
MSDTLLTGVEAPAQRRIAVPSQNRQNRLDAPPGAAGAPRIETKSVGFWYG